MKTTDMMKKAARLALLAVTVMCGACDDGEAEAIIRPTEPENPVEVSRIPALDEVKGVWNSGECLFDLKRDGLCYELDLSYGPPYYDGFVHDENGDYVYVKTSAYCEQYASDYNADPENTDVLTAEEAASRTFDRKLVCRFTVTDDKFLLEQGNTAGIADMIRGPYTYEPQTGLFTITNDFGSGETSKVYVFQNKQGQTVFLVMSEWFPFYTGSYDKSREYWILCPTYYFAQKAE